MSRVEYADKIAIAQPFSPAFFRQGEVRSATLLLDVLREKVPVKGLESAWEKIEADRLLKKKKLKPVVSEAARCRR